MANTCHLFIQTILTLVLLCFTSSKVVSQSSVVTSLPGFKGKFPSKHYAGYLSIGDNAAKKMFYYFVESEKSPANDPVVLWLNGGPGCSSLGGFVYEHGPFMFEPSNPFTSRAYTMKGDLPAKLLINSNSWSKVSNIIYLDSPVGVGFSYSLNNSDYKTGDLETAYDSHKFLLKWFETFPEHLNNSFYIAGESYAGISIPILALEIVKGVNSGSRPIINLKGYMIGNGLTDYDIDSNSIFPFAHGKGLISDDLYQDIINECQGIYFSANTSTKKCASTLGKFNKVIQGLNDYNILDPCSESLNDTDCRSCIHRSMQFSRIFGNFRLEVENSHAIHLRSEKNSVRSEVGSNITILCQDEWVPYLWLNHKEVRKAIHTDKEGAPEKWTTCADLSTYHMEINNTIEYHKKLVRMGLRVLIYSGDVDMVVPYVGSEAWTRSLGYKIIDEWRPWISNAQVAGYTQGYEKNFTFLTIKGAGHMVPQDKPREALDFYSRWLAEQTI